MILLRIIALNGSYWLPWSFCFFFFALWHEGVVL